MTDLINFREIRCYRSNNSMDYYNTNYKGSIINVNINGYIEVKKRSRIEIKDYNHNINIFSKNHTWLSYKLSDFKCMIDPIYHIAIRQKIGKIHDKKYIVFKNHRTVH